MKRYADAFEIPLKKRFRDLSRGNQTKLWLLLALAQQPDLLILDEPTAGLDPVVTDELLRVLIDDFASEGRSIFCLRTISRRLKRFRMASPSAQTYCWPS